MINFTTNLCDDGKQDSNENIFLQKTSEFILIYAFDVAECINLR